MGSTLRAVFADTPIDASSIVIKYPSYKSKMLYFKRDYWLITYVFLSWTSILSLRLVEGKYVLIKADDSPVVKNPKYMVVDKKDGTKSLLAIQDVKGSANSTSSMDQCKADHDCYDGETCQICRCSMGICYQCMPTGMICGRPFIVGKNARTTLSKRCSYEDGNFDSSWTQKSNLTQVANT